MAALAGPKTSEEAVRELYRRYHRPLFTWILRRVGDAGHAEDIVQESFLRLWRGAAAFDPARGSVPSLLFTIARNLATDLQRRGGRAADALRRAEAAPVCETTAVDDTVIRREVVRVALGGVTPAQRHLIDLLFWADAPQRQVAESLGVPVGTVKSRTHHALRSARAELAALGVS